MTKSKTNKGAGPPRVPPDAVPAEPPTNGDTDSAAAEMTVLFPGRTVNCGQFSARVTPMLVRHIREFSEPIEKTIRGMIDAGVDFNSLAGSWPQLMAHLLPLVMGDLFELLNSCTDVDLDSVPHWVLPQVAEAWINENFGAQDQLRPWFEVVSRILSKLGTEEVDLWATVSNSLSRPGTT